VVVVDYATMCALNDDVFVVGGSVDDCGRGDDDAPAAGDCGGDGDAADEDVFYC